MAVPPAATRLTLCAVSAAASTGSESVSVIAPLSAATVTESTAGGTTSMAPKATSEPVPSPVPSGDPATMYCEDSTSEKPRFAEKDG